MDIFNAKSLTFRRKVLVFFGAEIDISDTQTAQPLGYIKMKAFKLKEDIRIYTDATKTTEIMSIKARSIIDFGAVYDVFDSATQTPIMMLKRGGFTSTFVRDQWSVFDTNGQPYAQIEEVGAIAIFRRYFGVVPYIGLVFELVTMFLKQGYQITYIAGGQSQRAGEIKRLRNPFVVKLVTDMSQAEVQLDSRIMAGLGAMLSIIEGAKN